MEQELSSHVDDSQVWESDRKQQWEWDQEFAERRRRLQGLDNMIAENHRQAATGKCGRFALRVQLPQRRAKPLRRSNERSNNRSGGGRTHWTTLHLKRIAPKTYG
jgi:hypothetical protein